MWSVSIWQSRWLKQILSGNVIESAVKCAFMLFLCYILNCPQKDSGGNLEAKSKVKQAELKQISAGAESGQCVFEQRLIGERTVGVCITDGRSLSAPA